MRGQEYVMSLSIQFKSNIYGVDLRRELVLNNISGWFVGLLILVWSLEVLYVCAPERKLVKTLMMTAWAGRFTPQARVAVQTSTLRWPLENMLSIRLRSDRSIPAWWIPKPSGNISFICLFLDRWIWERGSEKDVLKERKRKESRSSWALLLSEKGSEFRFNITAQKQGDWEKWS